MKSASEYEKDLASIRQIMERSTKVLSLSGLSGVLAGIYALVGATVAYYLVQYPYSLLSYRQYSVQSDDMLLKLIVVAGIVLVASIITAFLLSSKKAKKNNESLWNNASKKMLADFSVPLVSGGLLVLIVLFTGHFGLAAPLCLLFYGIALVTISQFTFKEIRYLGFSEIVLGLAGAYFQGYGLLFWAIGFGILHIIYGSIMYFRYDK